MRAIDWVRGKAERQREIVRTLQAEQNGQTRSDLMRKFQCSPRTIEGDISELRRLGYPIEIVSGRRPQGEKLRLPSGFVVPAPVVVEYPGSVPDGEAP